MTIPPNVGPNVALLLQRLDLIEKKVDWVAQRVSWLSYNAAAQTQTEGNQPPAEESIPQVSAISRRMTPAVAAETPPMILSSSLPASVFVR